MLHKAWQGLWWYKKQCYLGKQQTFQGLLVGITQRDGVLDMEGCHSVCLRRGAGWEVQAHMRVELNIRPERWSRRGCKTLGQMRRGRLIYYLCQGLRGAYAWLKPASRPGTVQCSGSEHTAWVQNSSPLFSSCVTLHMLLNSSVP